MGLKFNREDYALLRKRLDGSDPFMTGAQVRKPRRPERKYPFPEWAAEQKSIRAFLVQAFPHINKPCEKTGKINDSCIGCELIRDEGNDVIEFGSVFTRRPCARCRQVSNAALWNDVIQLYFRRGDTDRQVESDLGLRPGAVGRIIQSIRKAHAGLRRDGRPRSAGKPGRKKKTATPACATQSVERVAKRVAKSPRRRSRPVGAKPLGRPRIHENRQKAYRERKKIHDAALLAEVRRSQQHQQELTWGAAKAHLVNNVTAKPKPIPLMIKGLPVERNDW